MENPKFKALFNEYFLLVVKDICLFKLQRYYQQSKSANLNFLVIKFTNKLVENVNIQKILNNIDVHSCFPHPSVKMKIPSISYSYTKTIRSEVVNYKETINNINGSGNIICACNNQDRKFIRNPYGHVFTGDLSIINDIQLRSLLQKGLNYRDQQSPDKNKAYQSFRVGIESYIGNISAKTHIAPQQFSEWRDKILGIVKEKLENMNPYKFCSILKNASVKKSLTELHKDFVITPIDKASNNVSIICKKFYIDTLKNEVQSSNTFKLCTKMEKSIFKEHKNYYQKLNIKYVEECQTLPYLYSTSKMHKVPPKFRFITCATSTSLEGISKILTVCLKRLLKFAKNRAKYLNAYTSYNTYFIVDDRHDIINFLTTSNFKRKFGGAKSVRTYDFSNLYTSIPHDKLKANIKQFVTEVFDASGKCFINVKNNKAYLSNKVADLSFNAKTLVDAIFYLIDNCFIKFEKQIYRQIVGIPMGTSCAPFLANIFLYVYEKNVVIDLVDKGKIDHASNLANIFRYQDDCIVLNDKGLFDTIYHDIYPAELTLLNTNISSRKVTFLDMAISLYQGKFKHYLYNKRDDFDFSVIMYPYLSGNIPKVPSYGVYLSQLLRICDICSDYYQFKNEVINLNKKLVNQGFQLLSLKRKFELFCKRYIHIWSKYGIDLFRDDILNALF